MASEEISEFLGDLVGSLLIPGVLALAAFYIGKRSPKAGTWTFFIVLALLVAGKVVTFVTKTNAQTELAQIHRQQVAATAAGDDKKGVEFAARTSAQLGAIANNASGQEQRAAEATKAYVDRLIAARKSYDSALHSLPGTDFWRLANLDAENSAAKCREAIQTFADANAAMAALQDENGGALRRELEQRGIAPEFVHRTMEAYRRKGGTQLRLLAAMRNADADIARAMFELLDFAEKNRGKWSVSSSTHKITFSDTMVREQYYSILERVKSANLEQEKIQTLLTPAK